MTTGVWSHVRRLCGCLTVAVLLGACSGDDAPVVQTLGVEPGSVTQTISAPGSVQPADRQPVAAAVPGVVAKLRFEDGETVDAGDVVVRLASDEVELALEQAEAALATSQSGVSVDPPGDAAIAAAHTSVRRLDEDVQPDLAKARRRADRIDDDKERKAAEATIALLEDAYRDVRTALLTAGEASAVQQNAIAATLSGALDQAVRQSSAGSAAQAAGAADSAQARAEDLKLRAPFSGVVSLGHASSGAAAAVPGDLGDAAGATDALAGGLGAAVGGEQGGRLRVGVPVSPGQTVFTIYDLSEYFVEVDVDEIDAPQLQEGQVATVLLDAFPDETFVGEVVAVAVAAQTSPTGGVAYPVRIRLRDVPDAGLRVGMTASADITTATVGSSTTVPARSIVRRGGGQAVFVVRDGAAVVVPVDVTALGEERAAVRSDDLRADDQVIVSGYEDLSDGDVVTVEQ